MRKTNNLLMALGLFALSVFLFSCNDLSDSTQQSEAIIQKHVD